MATKRSKGRRFNHARVTKRIQKIPISQLRLGTICMFDYKSKNTSDRKPLILFLGRDIAAHIIHGINLNYLSDYQVNQLFGRMNASAVPGGELVKDRVEVKGADDKVIREVDYYRISLDDVFGRTGDSKSVTSRLYDRYVKQYVKTRDVYRTYKESNIHGNFDIMFWNFDERALRRLGANTEKTAPKRTKYGTLEDANKKLSTAAKRKMDKE